MPSPTAHARRRKPAEPRRARGSAILGLGTALPARVVDNAELAARFGVDEHWIVKRIGVERRHVLAEGESLAALGAAAARRALDDAGLDPAAIDLVIVATSTSDQLLPQAAPVIATIIGTHGAGAFDVGAACAGFVPALAIAASHIEAGRAQRVLVIGADAFSRYVDGDDRRTATLFADGAGAVVLGADCDRRVTHCLLRSDGDGASLVYMTRELPFLRMDGERTYRFAVHALSEVTAELLAAARVTLDEVDLFVYHQANARILEAVGERLGLDPERVVRSIAGTGNTSTASIPLALAAAASDGRLRDGTRVLLAAIGAGWTWGAALADWGRPAARDSTPSGHDGDCSE